MGETNVSSRYSVKANGVEQTFVRSVRDISILNSFEEILINSSDHFKCTKLSYAPEK